MRAVPARWTSPLTPYIIRTNPRSGSRPLREGLASSSLASNPREWFNTVEEQQYRAQLRMEHSSDLSYKTYLQLARVKGTTSNGISGIKLHYYQFAQLPTKMAAIDGFRWLTAAQTIEKLFSNARHIRYLAPTTKTKEHYV
jgi:LPS sulfotransferase NodH